MKVKLFLLLFAICIVSCKTSSRFVSTTETHQQSTLEATQQSSTDAITSNQVTDQHAIDLDVTETTTYYDTSKPVITGTNKPPVVKETVTHIKKLDNSAIKQVSNQTVQSNSNNRIVSATKESTKEETKSSYKSEASLSLPWWIYFVVIVSILIALYFFCPPFRLFVNKIFAIVKSKWKKELSS
jgi:hypothetical protein